MGICSHYFFFLFIILESVQQFIYVYYIFIFFIISFFYNYIQTFYSNFESNCIWIEIGFQLKCNKKYFKLVQEKLVEMDTFLKREDRKRSNNWKKANVKNIFKKASRRICKSTRWSNSP